MTVQPSHPLHSACRPPSRVHVRTARTFRGVWAIGLLAACAAVTQPAQAQVAPVAQPPVTPAVDSARAALYGGNFDLAMQWFDRAIARDSNDLAALRESAAALSGRGRWREALPRVHRLTQLGINEPQLNHDYGLWLTWKGEIDSGAVYLRRAIAQAPDSLGWRLVLGQALTWNPRTRPEGVEVLRSLEKERAPSVALRHALASALAWDPPSRGEGIRRYEALLRENPGEIDVLVDYADVLSWIVDTRDEALKLYADAARQQPENARAAIGRLNVLSWTGRTGEALTLADSLMTASPGNAEIQRTRGSLLLQLGRVNEAVQVMRPLVTAAPNDLKLREQLAYALVAQGSFREARATARLLPEGTAPGAPDWVRRGASPAVGIDGLYTSTSFGLRASRFSVAASSPITATQRLTVSAGPVLFDAPNGSFNASFFTAATSGRIGRLPDVRTEVGLERYEDAPTAWSARVEASRQVRGSGTVRLAVRRAPVEDSRLAASGERVNGVFTGQVRANALDFGLRIPELAGGFGMQLSSTVAAYTGRALRTNFRRDATGTITRVIPLGAPRLETGLGVSLLSYVFDANRSPAVAPANEVGAYWSPTNFGNAILTLGLSLPVTGRVTVRLDGTAGRQFAGRVAGFTAFNVAGGADLRWIAKRGWDLNSGFLYIDNLGGFQLRQWRASVRHAF